MDHDDDFTPEEYRQMQLEQEEEYSMREQLAHMQTVLAILTKRNGGRIYVSAEELDGVVGHGIKMRYDEDDGGIELLTTPPEGEEEQEDALPAVTHEPLTNLQ